jgi:PEP-CTERM motif
MTNIFADSEQPHRNKRTLNPPTVMNAQSPPASQCRAYRKFPLLRPLQYRVPSFLTYVPTWNRHRRPRLGGHKSMHHFLGVAVAVLSWFSAGSLTASTIPLFSTGSPDGKIATLSRPAGAGLETETADDFILGQAAFVTNATFVGLLPSGTSLSSVTGVDIELYHVFPVDSNPPDGRVVTRTNSPSDNAFKSFDSGSLSVSAKILNPSFTAANSVVNGIHEKPNQFTGGEGAVTGEEVEFDVTFLTPFFVDATDHDFFRPEVILSEGDFLWLSAPKPIGAPGTAFQFPGGPTTDLQSWIRNEDLAPDWSRVGTDVTGQGSFNASFSLSGTPVPEPSSLLLLGSGLMGLAGMVGRRLARVGQ